MRYRMHIYMNSFICFDVRELHPKKRMQYIVGWYIAMRVMLFGVINNQLSERKERKGSICESSVTNERRDAHRQRRYESWDH